MAINFSLLWAKVLLLMGSSFALTSCYSAGVSYEFAKLYLSSQPAEEILKIHDPSHPRHKFISKVNVILNFLRKEGIDPSGSYEDIIFLDRDAISYGVSAAEKYKLKQKKWSFLFVGDVPYKSYFSKEKRDELASSLEVEFDVHKFEVAAFSGLGYFNDPLVSTMIGWPSWYLTKTIIHEVVHRNFWIKGSATLNELIAEAVAVELSQKFFLANNGSRELEKLKKSIELRKEKRRAIVSARKKLKTLYGRQLLIEELDLNKTRIFIELKKRLRAISPYSADSKPWNNARVLLGAMYLPSMKRFKKLQECVNSNKWADFFVYLENQSQKKLHKYLTSDQETTWQCR